MEQTHHLISQMSAQVQQLEALLHEVPANLRVRLLNMVPPHSPEVEQIRKSLRILKMQINILAEELAWVE
jgi:hypothetical protein